MTLCGIAGEIWAIVPVKPLRLAKSRLDPALGNARSPFMRALARRTMETLAGSPEIDRVLVLTSDSEVASDARAAGAQVLGDEGRGLNDALALGIADARRSGAGTCMVVPADLPLLDGQCLRDCLAAFDARGAAGLGVVRCKDGDGTTVTLFPADALSVLRYGPGSFAAHMAMPGISAFEITAPWAAFDVDTPADLDRLRRMKGLDPALVKILAAAPDRPSGSLIACR
jgi:2-phospho-L-lactate guanylyltransferase